MSVDPAYFGVDSFAFPVAAGGAADYPDPSDVAYGVVYGGGLYTGTLPCKQGLPSTGPKTLLHSPASIFQELLILLDLAERPLETSATDPDWTAYASDLPDTPEKVIVVYDTTAKGFGRDMSGNGYRTEHYGLQLLIRASTHPTSFQRVQQLAIALDEVVLNNVVAMTNPTAVYYVKDAVRSPVNNLGKDKPKSKRNLWTINLTTAIRRLS